jgi:GntR family transcriptional regulator
MRRLKSPQLHLLAKQEILNYVVQAGLETGSLLPSESELTGQLGVSRGTLREAMRILEDEGLVIRKQGVGTFIRDTRNLIRSTLDINEGVSEMIKGKGMEPGSRDVRIEALPANNKLAKHLRLIEGALVISVTRIRTADERPVAYTMDYLPQKLIETPRPEDFARGSLYTYIEKELGIELTNSLLEIQPCKAPKPIAHALDIKVGSLMLLLKQTDTDMRDEPILYSEEYFIADRFHFVVYRKSKRLP